MRECERGPQAASRLDSRGEGDCHVDPHLNASTDQHPLAAQTYEYTGAASSATTTAYVTATTPSSGPTVSGLL